MIIGLSSTNYFGFNYLAKTVASGFNYSSVLNINLLNKALSLSSATMIAFFPLLQKVSMSLIFIMMLIFHIVYAIL